MALSFEQLRRVNVARCEEIFHLELDSWSPNDWMTAVAGEVGEAANLLKKRHRGEEVSTVAIGHELADTVIYLDLLAARLGIDLAAAVRQKFNVVSERKGSAYSL